MRQLALLLLCSLVLPAYAATPILKLDEARYAGLSSEDEAINAFLGVPFAQPPVGDYRWRAAQPFEKIEGAGNAIRVEFHVNMSHGGGNVGQFGKGHGFDRLTATPWLFHQDR